MNGASGVFLIRRAKIDDVPTLLKLAKMVHFINLPADKDVISEKIIWSRNCFLRAADRPGGQGVRSGWDEGEDWRDAERSPMFVFTLEDTETGSVLGTSQIVARMGRPGHPNVSFQLFRREMFSESLQVGATHTVARLYLDESGPTEIGGLILQPSFRKHKQKLGRFLSLVRFHFMGLHRDVFSDHVLAEMMGPITPDGRNTLWEYLGRRFINLSYTEADRFCQHSKEFMTTLLPREDIYLTLLPPEARSVIAQVGPETVPARVMLERMGFEYRDRIDPFDGGPHLEARMDDIPLVRETERAELGEPAAASDCSGRAIVSVLETDGEFRSVQSGFVRDRRGRVRLPRSALKLLQAAPGAEAGVTVLEAGRSDAQAGGNGAVKKSGRGGKRARGGVKGEKK